MPRVPIEPDSRLTRPNPQRVEWALYTMRRNYKNAVKLTARYIGACCQCGRVTDVPSADTYTHECFNLSGFADPPMCMACLLISDRMNDRMPDTESRRPTWSDFAYGLFKVDVRVEVARLGIDPSDQHSIRGALMAPGSTVWNVASRHPHPFGGFSPRPRVQGVVYDEVAEFQVSPAQTSPSTTFGLDSGASIGAWRAIPTTAPSAGVYITLEQMARQGPAQQEASAPPPAPTTTPHERLRRVEEVLRAPWDPAMAPPTTPAGRVNELDAMFRETYAPEQEASEPQPGRPSSPDEDPHF